MKKNGKKINTLIFIVFIYRLEEPQQQVRNIAILTLSPELVERVTSIYKKERVLPLVEEPPREDILGLPKLSEETEPELVE